MLRDIYYSIVYSSKLIECIDIVDSYGMNTVIKSVIYKVVSETLTRDYVGKYLLQEKQIYSKQGVTDFFVRVRKEHLTGFAFQLPVNYIMLGYLHSNDIFDKFISRIDHILEKDEMNIEDGAHSDDLMTSICVFYTDVLYDIIISYFDEFRELFRNDQIDETIDALLKESKIHIDNYVYKVKELDDMYREEQYADEIQI